MYTHLQVLESLSQIVHKAFKGRAYTQMCICTCIHRLSQIVRKVCIYLYMHTHMHTHTVSDCAPNMHVPKHAYTQVLEYLSQIVRKVCIYLNMHTHMHTRRSWSACLRLCAKYRKSRTRQWKFVRAEAST